MQITRVQFIVKSQKEARNRKYTKCRFHHLKKAKTTTTVKIFKSVKIKSRNGCLVFLVLVNEKFSLYVYVRLSV